MISTCKNINCVIYKSAVQTDTFLFLLKENGFSDVPDTLLKSLGHMEIIMQLTLTPDSRLARNNTKQVLRDLESQGYHLQMPAPTHSLLNSKR